jgi:L-ribulose-5-phosphate 3-epimerase
MQNGKRYSLGLYEKALPDFLSWREKMEFAKKSGFDFLEISIDETEEKLRRLDMSLSEIFAMLTTMKETGIPIRSLCLSGHRKYPIGSSDPETEKRGMDIMAKALRFADSLGIRIIMLAGYDVYYEKSTEQTRSRFEQNLQICVDMAAKAGIILAFETMETPFMNSVEKAMYYVDRINSPYLQVYPDIGNIMNSAIAENRDVLDDLNLSAGHIVALHLKETLPGKYRDMQYGQGHVDFSSAITTAWKLGVRRYVTEFWYLGNDNWPEDVVAANRYMTVLLDKEKNHGE